MLTSSSKMTIERANGVQEYGPGDLFAAVGLKPSKSGEKEVLQFVSGSGSHEDMLSLVINLKCLEKGIIAATSKVIKLPEPVLEFLTDLECIEVMKGKRPESPPPDFKPTAIDISSIPGFEEFLRSQGFGKSPSAGKGATESGGPSAENQPKSEDKA